MALTGNNLSATDGAGRIPSDIAQELILTYKTEEGWAGDKTRAVWFSAADFTDIIAQINENGGDGSRIYFGKYPSDTDIPGTPDPTYKGRVTLVFIPTVAQSDGTHQDLFPPIPPPSFVAAAAASSGGPVTGFNHGELCPPNCNS